MYYLLPFIASAIGWVTNFFAIKMLFHPKEPIKILGLTIQGIFPKRQAQLADKLGDVVSNELFSINDIKGKLDDPDLIEHASKLIDDKVDDYLRNKLPESMPMLKMFMNDSLVDSIKIKLVNEFESSLPDIIEGFVSKLEEKVNIKEIVSEKVSNFSTSKFEEILFAIMKKEFRFIEIIGAILGFIIGCVQLLFI